MGDGAPTLEGHAAQIRGAISDVMGSDEASNENGEAAVMAAPTPESSPSSSSGAGTRCGVVTKAAASVRRGPSIHRYNLGTWSAYHAARIAAGSIAGATQRSGDKD